MFKKISLLFFVVITLFTSSVFASNLPRDTQFLYGDVSASGNTLLLATSTRTILDMSIVSNSNTPIGLILCGTVEIYDNKQIGNGFNVDTNYVCTSAIYLNKNSTTGGFSVYINYVNRDRTVTPDPYSEYSTSTPVTIANWTLATSTTVLNWASSTLKGLQVNCIQGCDGTTTVNFPSSLAINNFPTGFNINNFPSLQTVAVNNFPSLQNVNCTIGCNGSSTLILSSSTVNVLTTSAPTFNEWLFICGVFLAINSIHLWNFIFRRPQKIK